MPVHNEGRWIHQLLERVVAQPDVGQLIIVDDASTDDSLAVVKRFAATVQRPIEVTVIPLTPNQGKGAAVNRGFATVTRPYVIIQDADLEYDPADYRVLLAPLRSGEARVVFGSRFLGASSHVTLHDAGNRFLSWFTSWLFGVQLTDMNTCYKCFDSRFIVRLNCTERRFAWDPQLTAQLIRQGQQIVERPISYQPRTVAEGKKIRWQDGFAQLRILSLEWLRYPRAWFRLLIALAASGALIVGLFANQLATLQRVHNHPLTFFDQTHLERSIAIDQAPRCHTGTGFVVAGPYVTLPPGRYRYTATLTGPGAIRAQVDASSGPLGRTFAQVGVTGVGVTTATIDVELPVWAYEAEFRVNNTQDSQLCVTAQTLTRTDLRPGAALVGILNPIHSHLLPLP